MKKEKSKHLTQDKDTITKKQEKTLGEKILATFSLKKDQEKLWEIMEDVRDGIPFRGTNLWVLILAILIASIGLNINSPAVVIGAMLISPLMGPIIGIGVSLAIHDISLLKKAIANYFLAVGISLATSLLYFSISPIQVAHSEILARTSPTLYDVLIALFGGIAGSIVLASTKKWNVVPGVAIATALMPPICTAGYAIATLNLSYFIGSFYLFIINTVFITVSAFAVARILRFPYKGFPDDGTKSTSKRIVLLIVTLTVIPSIYFGYDIVQQTQFSEKAKTFIKYESHIEWDYLLDQTIDTKTRTIELIYGWKPVTKEQIEVIKNKLPAYSLENTTLEIKQGFASLYEKQQKESGSADQNAQQIKELTVALEKSQSELSQIKENQESQQELSKQVIHEAELLYPEIVAVSFSKQESYTKSGAKQKNIGYILLGKEISNSQKQEIQNWLKVRTGRTDLKTFFEVQKAAVDEKTLSESAPAKSKQ